MDSSTETVCILVEVDEREVMAGVSKAGIKEAAGSAIAEAKMLFENAVGMAIGVNVRAFQHALEKLPTPPTDAEISFGLKVTGEVGNVVISKIAGEANYSVKLVWKSDTLTKAPL
jgi:hypothetical protein